MRSLFLILSLVIVCFGAPQKIRSIPTFVKICNRNDPNLNECFKNSLLNLQPKMAKGIPELFVPKLEPLNVPAAHIRQNGFNANFKNINVEHLTEFKIAGVEIDLENGKINLKLEIPFLRIGSDYEINGKLLVLQLNGHGIADGNYTDVSMDIKLSGHKLNKNQGEFLSLDTANVKLNIRKAKFYFAGLFKDPELTDATNRVINENSDALLDELRPVIQETIEEIILGLLIHIFDAYPLDLLFPK